MELEIRSATNFITYLISKSKFKKSITKKQRRKFNKELYNILIKRYKDRWYTEMPHKGSGYRCIRIGDRYDPVIVEACRLTGWQSETSRLYFPNELTIWIDPNEVRYRIGTNGSIITLYNKQTQLNKGENTLRPWQPQDAETHQKDINQLSMEGVWEKLEKYVNA